MGQEHNLSPHILTRLSKRINQPYSGFTVKAQGTDVGNPAKDSYMVGLAQHGKNDMPLPITAEQISDFANSRGKALSEPSNYLGGFNDTDKGNKGSNPGSLDVSKAFPRSEGLALPMMQAHYGGERPEDSVGILDKKGEYAGEVPTFNPIGMLYYHDEE